MSRQPGRQFLNIPGPTNIPDRVLQAMHRPALDFMTPEFWDVQVECKENLAKVLKTEGEIMVYAASGHGSWEAAMTNTCSPGDTILMCETGRFSESWGEMAEAMGLKVVTLANDWDRAFEADRVAEALAEDKDHAIKAVCVVHNETSTGITHDVESIGKVIKASGHPALFMVDTISSLASMDFRMDEWGVDVAVAGSQKGLMLPVGLGISGVSAKAMAASETATLPRKYFDWDGIKALENGRLRFAGTAPSHLFFAMREGLKMLLEEGLDHVFARHARLAEATRRAVKAWGRGNGPSLFGRDEAALSNSVTAIRMPDGFDADAFRGKVLAESNVALGGGLSRLSGKVIRIGHLGDLNEPMILGCLATVEMQLKRQGIPHGEGGVDAAVKYLAETR
ncbi:pyridoxal-phosphate-dependent aminotransferase family protein [Thalassobaculum salexigens]|uniref:pyridoxal-phosphate-dependent aminotransferase family protein n=1 Tax=Thalassobaculum salexigens TaxID=455360 RepID=UPI00248D87D0|nr:aminotransferase class V-fold PLP-dependent enzyme [Thalassobaculum salexigens]